MGTDRRPLPAPAQREERGKKSGGLAAPACYSALRIRSISCSRRLFDSISLLTSLLTLS